MTVRNLSDLSLCSNLSGSNNRLPALTRNLVPSRETILMETKRDWKIQMLCIEAAI
jgi:hypothetical protein